METLTEEHVTSRRDRAGAPGNALQGWRLEACWASCEDDVRAAQQLRYRVFVEEMGALPHSAEMAADRIEADRYDCTSATTCWCAPFRPAAARQASWSGLTG